MLTGLSQNSNRRVSMAPTQLIKHLKILQDPQQTQMDLFLPVASHRRKGWFDLGRRLQLQTEPAKLECLASIFKCSAGLKRIYLCSSGICKRFWQATLLFNDDPECLSLSHRRTPCRSLKRRAKENVAFKIPRHGKPLSYQKWRQLILPSPHVGLSL